MNCGQRRNFFRSPAKDRAVAKTRPAPTRPHNLNHFGAELGGVALVGAAALFSKGRNAGGALVLTCGIEDVVISVPGVLEDAGVVGEAGGNAGEDCCRDFPRFLSNALGFRL